MAFNFRESFWGLEHLRLKACRHLFKMKPDEFIERLNSKGLHVIPCLDLHGAAILCSICGFTQMRSSMIGGWHLECCSALPVVHLDNKEYQNWSTTLVNSNFEIPRADGGAILHD